jgi:opacity protein-like surface antigen
MGKPLRWILTVALVVLIAPAMASAQQVYGALRGGPGFTSDLSRRYVGAAVDAGEFELNTGFTGGVAVGYMFPFGLRAEAEAGFLTAPLKSELRQSFLHDEVNGSIKSYLFMANAYYDVKIPWLGPFKPYVGFGLGGARLNTDYTLFRSCDVCVAVPGRSRIDVDDWRTAFAYQARGGMVYKVNRRLDLSLGYRYVHIDSGRVREGFLRFDQGSINNHSLELGFAIKF